ncbi:glycine cleavage system aminomethyltransferase GcvT [Chryseomicrobium sp. FSL W7-1435]|uniref:glycine cleavage system aminomethyltransferase GcvT n=1 Tax=Chryseomicrobium sp. FSL W7-1435 TaxID=2921704 RepID=UPI003159DC2C
MQRTPLYDLYAEYGAKTIDFGGWDLPVQFSSIKEEHEAVRTKAGLFDVSHMGEVWVSGADSEAFIQNLITNDVTKLTVGKALYAAMCYEDGGTVDDLLVYKFAEDKFLLVVNASNIEKDVDWMKQHLSGDVTVDDQSNDWGLLALQGPVAQHVLQQLTETDLSELKFFHFTEGQVDGKEVIISRTGYTGEDGFELYAKNDALPHLWKSLLSTGQQAGVVPAGLGARDTLRFEACLPLYGQELNKDISPLEAGIGFAVKTAKDAFIGKDAIVEKGKPRKSVGIEMLDKGIPRHGYKVFSGEQEIGEVTTGTQSPTLKKNIGLALVASEFTEQGQQVEVEIRGKRLKAVVVPTPFYKRQK